jgi:hypothetical protein
VNVLVNTPHGQVDDVVSRLARTTAALGFESVGAKLTCAVLVVLLAACSSPSSGAEQAEPPPATSSPVAVTAAPPEIVVQVPNTTTAPTATTTLPPVPETTATATTLPAEPETLGLLLAERLASALADGDWSTARAISPLPDWDNQTYAEGFAGLDASTVFLGGVDDSDPDRLVMYLMQVAHESRQEGAQTSIYCVRWDLLIDSSTIDKVAGELLLREPGFTPPADAERGAFQCDRFDRADDPPTALPTPAAPTAEPPAYSGPPAYPQTDINGYSVITFSGSEYLCWRAFTWPSGSLRSDYDCQRYRGEAPPFVLLAELHCSTTAFSLECTTEDYYPSELDGY